jgi:hypothetical protein
MQTALTSPTADNTDHRAEVARGIELIGSGALAVVAGAHLLDLADKFAEVPYLGVAYVGLIAGSIAAIGLLLRHDRRGWMLGGGLALATIIGYVLNRTVGLPNATEDIGNWSEPLAIWALLAEVIVVALSVHVLRKGEPTLAT